MNAEREDLIQKLATKTGKIKDMKKNEESIALLKKVCEKLEIERE